MYLITIAITFLPLFLVEENIIKPRDKKRVIKYLYFFSALFLVLLACLRDNTLGNDVRNYMSVYFVNSRTHELGFWVLIDIVRFFIRDFQVFISINSILSLVPILISFYIISKRKWLSLLMFQALYLYASSFSLLRQFLAIGWVMLAMIVLKLYFERSNKLSVKGKVSYIVISMILILIGSLFHYSSLAMLILPIIAIIERRYYLIILFALAGLIMFFFREPIISFIVLNVFETKDLYLDFQPEIGVFPVLQFSAILINQFIYRIKSRELTFIKNEKEYLFVTNLAVLWLLTILAFSWFPNLARVTMYITMVMCAFLPNFVEYKVRTYLLIIVAFISYYWFSLNYRDYQGIYPFRWIRNTWLSEHLQ